MGYDPKIKAAEEARCNMNTLYGVIAILEQCIIGGEFNGCNKASARIIKICKTESVRQVRIYDKYKAKP